MSSLLGVNRFTKAFFCFAWLLLVTHEATADGSSPSGDFSEAVSLDLEGKAQLAFNLYLRAATAGLPQAQFNVAVMLDSGRGVKQNIFQAALWYARAAAHGNQRAAYNMGQLYESGEGVPQNSQMARAWFAASGLTASSSHLRDGREDLARDTIPLTAPEIVAPFPGSDIAPEAGGIVLIWTSRPQPVSINFYVEMRAIDSSGAHEVFARSVNTSSVYVPLHQREGSFAWRVTAFSDQSENYIASGWAKFKILSSN